MPEKNEEKNEKETGSFHDYRYNHRGKIFLLIFGLLIILGGIFVAGSFVFHFGGKDHRNTGFVENKGFGGGHMISMMNGFRDGFHHGISGQITAIDGSNITVKSSGKDYAVVTSDSTSVKLGNGDIGKLSDLQVNNAVTVVGSSNSNGQITATLIAIQ